MTTEQQLDRVKEYCEKIISPNMIQTGGCVTISPNGHIVKGSLASKEIPGSRVIHYSYRNGETTFELGQQN